MHDWPLGLIFIFQTGSFKHLRRWQLDPLSPPSHSWPSKRVRGGPAEGPLSPSQSIWPGGLRTPRWHEKASPEAGNAARRHSEMCAHVRHTLGKASFVWAHAHVWITTCLAARRERGKLTLQDVWHGGMCACVCVCVRVNKGRAIMTVSHMIRLHGHTNGISPIERPAGLLLSFLSLCFLLSSSQFPSPRSNTSSSPSLSLFIDLF